MTGTGGPTWPPSAATMPGGFDTEPGTGGVVPGSDREPAHGRRLAAAGIVLSITAVLVFSGVAALVQARRPPRALPAAAVDRIVFVVFPDFPEPVADAIRNDIAARYRIPGSIFVSSVPLDPAAWNPLRRQFGAERALDSMLAQTPRDPSVRTLVIGLTSADLYIESVDWNWAFALRRNGAALVSMERMHRPLELDGARSLMRKMVVREIGFLGFGLSPTDDPGDLMYRNVLSVNDLVEMADDL